ncbi:PHD finger protein 20 isoform X2 [Dendrobates tinctorius]|uniref:PHD finger protein 20 isoform X2 n=1 Tax=Dendrobates tinctorius TaxID=92724 RepID=UPI003CCA31A1
MTKHPPNRRGITFEVGSQLEARDRLKKWYAAHIEEIDYEEGKVLIHFKRWNHRYDEWFCWDSPYLRPLEKIQLRREGLVEEEPTTVFRVNEQVLACWSDCRFYPAKITSVNKDGSYTVKFFDGVIQTVKNIHVKAFSKDQANAARSKPRERPTESTSPSDKQRGKFREQRKSSEKNTTTIEKEKTQTPDKKGGQANKDKKPVPCEKSKAPAVKNEKEDKENISENERDSSAETRPEERSSQNDSLKVPHENGERRRKRDRSSSLTSSDPGLQTLQPVTLELRRRKISIASETPSKRPRLEKRKSVAAATASKTENVSDGEQPCVDDESEKDHKPVQLSPSRSQEDLSEVDLKSESAPGVKLVHQNGPSVEQDALSDKLRTEDCTSMDHVKPEHPEVKGSPLPLEDVVKPAATEEESGLPDIKTDGHEMNLSGPNEIQMITTLSVTNTLKKPDDPAAKAVTLDLDANRFKCKILDCSKSFRKAKLLHYHMKYFHGVEKAEQDLVPMTRHMQTRGSLAHEKISQQTSKRRRTTSGSLHPPLQISLRSSPHHGKDLICEKRRHSSPATNSANIQRATLKEKSKENQIQKTCHRPEKSSDNVKDNVKEKFKELLSLKSKKKKKKKKRTKSELSGSEENVDISKTLSPKKTNPIKIGADYKTSCSIKTSDHVKRRETTRISDEETLSDSCTESLLWSDDDDYNEEIDVTNAEEDEAECEIVRCMCEVQEENDFMIQCEECLCWQHGVCMGLLEDTVPEKYTCYVCQDPPGQRVSLKYWYDKEWLNEGHMHGLSFLEENYSHQNAKKIVATHQLLGDVQRVIEVLHGLQLKMSILQSKEHPDLRFWGHPWKQHALNDRCYIGRTVEENSCKEDSTNYRTYNGSVDKPSPIPSVEESYITSEHCYQKPRTYYPAVEQRLVVETRSSSLDGGVDRIRQNREDSIAERLGWDLDRELLKVRECLSKRNPPPEAPHAQPADNGDATVSSQLQWQLNLLTHLESLQDEVTHRMDFIEKELDVLESFLDYTGELEPPEPLARLPQLKHRIKQLLMDLGKVEQIALCST